MPSNAQPNQQSLIDLFAHLQQISAKRLNKNSNEYQTTVLVGLEVISQRIEHDNQGLKQMKEYLKNQINLKMIEMEKRLSDPIKSNLNKIKGRNYVFFERILKLEEKICLLAKRSNKLERKQTELETFQGDMFQQKRVCVEIENKIERVRVVSEYRDFSKDRNGDKINGTMGITEIPEINLQRKKQIAELLGKLQDSVLKLSNEVKETEKIEAEVVKYSRKGG